MEYSPLSCTYIVKFEVIPDCFEVTEDLERFKKNKKIQLIDRVDNGGSNVKRSSGLSSEYRFAIQSDEPLSLEILKQRFPNLFFEDLRLTHSPLLEGRT